MYFSGDDSNVLPHLSLGATGLIGVTANIAPHAYRQMVDATNKNDFHAKHFDNEAKYERLGGITQ